VLIDSKLAMLTTYGNSAMSPDIDSAPSDLLAMSLVSSEIQQAGRLAHDLVSYTIKFSMELPSGKTRISQRLEDTLKHLEHGWRSISDFFSEHFQMLADRRDRVRTYNAMSHFLSTSLIFLNSNIGVAARCNS